MPGVRSGQGDKVLRTGENGASFRVPPTLVPETAEEAVESWTGRYPVVVKPRTGTGSEGLRLARDADELGATFALVSRRYPKLMVQEQICYRPGAKFVLLYLFDAGRRLRSWYAQRVLLERRSISIGIGAGRERMRGGVALLWRSVKNDDLLERGRRLLEALGWCGIAAIECARDERDGQYYLFEINARLDGTSTLALRDGPNFAYNSCLVALDRELPLELDLSWPRRPQRSLHDAGRTGVPFRAGAPRSPFRSTAACLARPCAGDPRSTPAASQAASHVEDVVMVGGSARDDAGIDRTRRDRRANSADRDR